MTRHAVDASRTESGFTLLEVMVALLLGMIGLLGTIALQQSMLRATQNANDAAVAMRLSQQTAEEFKARGDDQFTTVATGAWSAFQFLDTNGQICPTDPPTSVAEKAMFRWQRRWRVVDPGGTLPYRITIEVHYDLDGGTPKISRIDMERRRP